MRVLLIGGGCRGLSLTENLVADGHAVRAVTRDEAKRRCIEHAGAECWIGDPDVVGTLRYALENVTILVWALGTASGTPDEVAALHGPRLEMMLSKSIDTTVRGVLYEAAGSVAPELLEGGIDELQADLRAQRDAVRGAARRSRRRERVGGGGARDDRSPARDRVAPRPRRVAQRSGTKRTASSSVRSMPSIVATGEDEVLAAVAGDGGDQPAPGGELLLEQRRNRAARRRGDVDRVERRPLGQPGGAVADDDRDVVDAGERERARRLLRELRLELDAVDVTAQPRQQRRVVARAGPDVEHDVAVGAARAARTCGRRASAARSSGPRRSAAAGRRRRSPAARAG